jgi:hypothetical protein
MFDHVAGTACFEHKHQHSDDFLLLLVQCKAGHVRKHVQAYKHLYD